MEKKDFGNERVDPKDPKNKGTSGKQPEAIMAR